MRLYRAELTSLGIFVAMLAGLFLVASLSGCATLQAKDSDRCHALAGRYELWGGISIASMSLAGSGALTAPIPEERAPRFALGIMSASLTALGAAALFVRDDVLSMYTNECQTDAALEPADPPLENKP